MFGTPAVTDPVRRLIGAASAWGGNPEAEALYLKCRPSGQRRQREVRAHCR